MTEVYETEVDFSDDGYAEMTEFTDEEVIARGRGMYGTRTFGHCLGGFPAADGREYDRFSG